jgi:UPF0271 protein
MKSIDLNCDLGEGYGIYQAGPDEAIYPLISSANIACGFHAGDPQTMRQSVSLAVRHGVSIGAHPGTPDLQGFGRRGIELSTEEIENVFLYQIGALEAFAREAGARIHHIKPHGWFYNRASTDYNLAKTIVRTLKKLNPDWILFGAAGSELVNAAKQEGLPVAEEVFADRTYKNDGRLTPRSQPGSLITDPAQAAGQCLDVILNGHLKTGEGTELSLRADTICVHGDNPSALPILERLRQELLTNGYQILPSQGS